MSNTLKKLLFAGAAIAAVGAIETENVRADHYPYGGGYSYGNYQPYQPYYYPGYFDLGPYYRGYRNNDGSTYRGYRRNDGSVYRGYRHNDYYYGPNYWGGYQGGYGGYYQPFNGVPAGPLQYHWR